MAPTLCAPVGNHLPTSATILAGTPVRVEGNSRVFTSPNPPPDSVGWLRQEMRKRLVTGGEVSQLPEALVEEAERREPLTGVKAYPARVTCATLPWHAFEAALKGGAAEPVKTE